MKEIYVSRVELLVGKLFYIFEVSKTKNFDEINYINNNICINRNKSSITFFRSYFSELALKPNPII